MHCDDGDPCTLSGQCSCGFCMWQESVVCEDDNPCSNDLCDPLLGCQYVPNNEPCDDGLSCTLSDTCNAGACESLDFLTCDDGNPCTEDGCQEPLGCSYVPLANGASCGVGQVCQAGECIAQPCLPESMLFEYTGNPVAVNIPSCVTTVYFEVWGAAGGHYQSENYAGKGGYARAQAPDLAEQVLWVYVGGEGGIGGQTAVGGWNGGGGHTGGNSYTVGGGGASDVRLSGQSLTDRIIVAGGGGGSAWTYASSGVGGQGGGLVGGNGGHSDNSPSGYGTGGTQSSGGVGGNFSGSAPNGTFGVGGAAKNTNSGHGGAGAGGGGYYGGGGGAHGGGGGGGSSWFSPSMQNSLMEQGVRSGNGKVVITWE